MIEICCLCKASITSNETPALNAKNGQLAHIGCMKGKADIHFYNEVPNVRMSRVQLAAKAREDKAEVCAPVVAAPKAAKHVATPEESANHWIQSYTGLAVEPLCLQPSMINIFDIAHALSNLCRYTGHTVRLYSVAQHCLGVSTLVRMLGGGKKAQLWGLLHDAGEAYLSDIAAPMKKHPIFEGYRLLEADVDRRIRSKFGLNIMNPEDLRLVKLADTAMLTPEKKRLMAADARPWGLPPSLVEADIAFTEEDPASIQSVEERFLQRFADLTIEQAMATPPGQVG